METQSTRTVFLQGSVLISSMAEARLDCHLMQFYMSPPLDFEFFKFASWSFFTSVAQCLTPIHTQQVSTVWMSEWKHSDEERRACSVHLQYSLRHTSQSHKGRNLDSTSSPLLLSPSPLPLLPSAVKDSGRPGNQSDLSWNPNSPTDHLCESGQITTWWDR